MLKKTKSSAFKLVFAHPRSTGWTVFVISILLTLVLSFVGYQLQLSQERELVNDKLNQLENLLTTALNDGVSAAKILGIISQNQENIIADFQNIGRQILESNPHVDAIEFLQQGTIAAVYPLEGNEAAIGYDVLKNPMTRKEVEEAIKRKDVYFSGPIQLKQGGFSIVGRYPLFKDQKLIGISAVIIHFEKLLLTANLEGQADDRFSVQFSKVNPNSGVLENFLNEQNTENYTGHRSSIFLEVGNWNLSVQLKKSTALAGLFWKSLASIIGSILVGLVVWSFARQPLLLEKKVKEQSQEIIDANERFQLASKATSDVLWDWDLVTDAVYRSEHFLSLLGYERNEQTSNNNFWQSIIHPDDLEPTKNQLLETLAGTGLFWNEQFRVKKGDGTYAFIIDKGFIIRDADGKAVRMIGAFQDISAQKATELELLDLNQRLSNANEELKIFASLASHDLREPLRMISSFMSLLEKKYGPSLDEKANQYISFAMDGAKRLTVMIADLLEYSKIGFESSTIESIDTDSLVDEVLKLKSNLIREYDAEIIVTPLPKIKGVKIPIQLLFQNLIGNALKYRHPDIKSEIKISGRELEDFWEFSVKDNGIGIDADYLEQIFGILKRLHPKEKYPGTGMGLATCRKIVTQHQGKIWAESSDGLGSEFLFTIKKHE